MNILFVCSQNKWRSRTAETIFKNNRDHIVKSAGTQQGARIRVTEKMIEWAELIFVMEKVHRERLKEKFGNAVHGKKIFVLEIEDKYQYMDIELVDMLQTSVANFL